MKEKKNKNQWVKVFILVIALIVLAFSGTYAYFTSSFIGEPNTTTAKSGVFKVESSLETSNAINNKKMILINENQREEKAEKLTFTITSTSESTIDGKFSVYLKNIKLSKNLYSKYLKWELLKEKEIISSGDFENAIRIGSEEANEEKNVLTDVEEIKLNIEELELPKNTTQTFTFRMYLLNDTTKNQIELTEGSFSGRLYIEAIPVSETNS